MYLWEEFQLRVRPPLLPVCDSRGSCVDYTSHVLLMEPKVKSTLPNVVSQSGEVFRINGISSFQSFEGQVCTRNSAAKQKVNRHSAFGSV